MIEREASVPVERYRVQLQDGFLVQWDLSPSSSRDEWEGRVRPKLKEAGAVQFGATSVSIPRGRADLQAVTKLIQELLGPSETAWLVSMEGDQTSTYVFAHPKTDD